MPQVASARCGGRTETEEAVPAMFARAGRTYVMDHYMVEIELVEWHRKTRERSARATMFALARQEDTEADISRQPEAPEPARAHCRCWHGTATSPNA